MIKEALLLQSASLYGSGGFGNILDAWAKAGVFDYMIPFLLIFSLVFGILTQLKIFKENKSINAIIALAVGLMSLQFGFVSAFFSEIFPRLGVGLVILLVLMILFGLFAPSKTWVTYTFVIVSLIVFVVVLANSADSVQWMSTGVLAEINWDVYLPWIVLGIMIAIVIGASKSKSQTQDASSKFMKALAESS